MRTSKILWFLPILILCGTLLAENSVGPAPLELYRGKQAEELTKADRAYDDIYFRGETTYGIESANGWFASFDCDVPEILTNLGGQATAGFSNAGDFDAVDQSYVYELTNSNEFGTYNLVTGAYTALAPISPNGYPGKTWVAMALDVTTGIMYAASTDLSTSDLYTIDPIAATCSLVGAIGQPGVISLAVDGDGNMWSHDLVNDTFLSIDKATGAGTVVGPLGFDANFGQGMTLNPATGDILMAAFNNTAFQPQLRLVDTATGSSTLIGVLGATAPGGLCQFGWIAIPGEFEPPIYCEASGGNDEWIDGVEFEEIVNLTNGYNTGYEDFTDMVANVTQGETYDITIYTGNYYTSDDYGVWIDFNRDYDFYDAGENVVCVGGMGAEVNTFSITIPTGVPNGNTRMRVRLKYSGADCGDPCGATTYGEVEDYTVHIGPPPSYCPASGGNDEYIDGVELNTISNLGNGYTTGYEDFTYLSTDLVLAFSYDITIHTGNYWTSDDYAVWIDFNHDYDFYDAGENVVCVPDVGAPVNTFNFTVPADAMTGETRMRVRMKYSGATCGDPCGDTTFGEVEDYTVNIGGEPPDFGFIEGIVTLSGGGGNVEDVVVTAGGQSVNPNDTGFYSIALYPGTYDVDAVLEGYYPDGEDNVVVTENNVTTVDLTLIEIIPGALPLLENFDEGIPFTWEVVDYLNDGHTWEGVTSYNGNTLDGTPFAFVNSDGAGIGPHLIEELISPYVDASSVGALLLEFDQYYNYLGTPEFAAVDVWDGGAWVNVATYQEDHGAWGSPEHMVIDLLPWANASLQVRFLYDDGAGWMWWWAVDNFMLYEPLYGTVSGHVTEFGTGIPIEDAHVYFSGYEDYTDASGYYEISPVMVGTYTVNVESDYYLPASTPGVVVTDGGNTVVDFTLLYSLIDVEPDLFMVNVPVDNTVVQTMIITNDGPGELEYSCSAMEDEGNRIFLPPYTEQLKRVPNEVSIGPAPLDGIAVLPSDVPFINLSREVIAYGIESSNGFLCNFDLDVPEVLNYMGPEMTSGFSNAGAFMLGDESKVYELDNENNFGYYDIATGAWTSMDDIIPPGAGAQTWTGMCVDPTNGDWYGVTTDISNSNLYYIDHNVWVASLVGSTGQPGLIDVCVDGNGDMWAYDLVTDEFVSLDKNTGAATVIGSLGYDANFGQGMAWEPSNDEIYLSAFNNGTFQPELRLADRTTGNTTLLGVLGATDPGGLCQLGWMAIPGGGVNWISFDPQSGVVAPDGGQGFVTVTFDATGLNIGDILNATIHISNNAKYYRGDDYLIPATMIVTSESNDNNDLPLANELEGNYPNPFNPITTIGFSTMEAGNVSISVFNIKGERVTTLFDGNLEAGHHEITWDGTDNSGKSVSSGIYFYKMKTGRYTSTKKMVLMK